MKRLVVLSLSVMALALLFFGCTGETGPTGPEGPAGPSAAWYDFSLNFSPTVSSGYFSLYAHTIYADNDAVITYWKADSVTFVQLPYNFYSSTTVPVYFYTVIDESYDEPWLWVLTKRADTVSGSPWSANVTCNFRAVVIKTTPGKSPPKVDYGNYLEVKKYYNLPE
jgi:hypothetical protein